MQKLSCCSNSPTSNSSRNYVVCAGVRFCQWESSSCQCSTQQCIFLQIPNLVSVPWNILQHLQNCKSVAYAPSFLEATPEVCQRGTYPIMDTSCFCSCICYTCVHSSHESCNTCSRWKGNQRSSQDFANFIHDYGKLPAINLKAT